MNLNLSALIIMTILLFIVAFIISAAAVLFTQRKRIFRGRKYHFHEVVSYKPKSNATYDPPTNVDGIRVDKDYIRPDFTEESDNR